MALDTILISFRVGLLAATTRDQILLDRKNLAPWRVRIETDKTNAVLQQLEGFCNQKVVFFSSQTNPNCELIVSTASAYLVKAVRVLRVSRFSIAQWNSCLARRIYQ